MKGYFHNALETDNLMEYPLGYDRVYDGKDVNSFYYRFFSDGILNRDGADSCRVYLGDDELLHIHPGFAVIQGQGVDVEGDETAPATEGIVVIRLDRRINMRNEYLAVVDEPEYDPERIWDLPIAKVSIDEDEGVKLLDLRQLSAFCGEVAQIRYFEMDIPTEGWERGRLEDKSSGVYTYYIDVPVKGLLEYHSVDIRPDLSSLEAIFDCRFAPVVEVMDGYFRLWSSIPPGRNLTGEYVVTVESSSLQILGADGYELPPASEAILGGVLVGDKLEIEEDGRLSATGEIPEELIGTDEDINRIFEEAVEE